jgi:hypothetical protein
MTNTEFIKNICIGEAQVSDGEIAKHQALVHWLMNKTPGLLFISADGIKAGLFNRGTYERAKNDVEIDFLFRRILLSSKWHKHKAKWSHDQLAILNDSGK